MTAQSAAKLVAKEMKALAKLDFHLDQVDVLMPQENNVLALQLRIKPTGGYFKDGTFLFDMAIPEEYPEKPPKFTPVHKVFHPNIDQSVGLSTFYLSRVLSAPACY
jgi:ubiquitin-protein ligase